MKGFTLQSRNEEHKKKPKLEEKMYRDMREREVLPD